MRAGLARRADGREDPAAGFVQLLVARTRGPERELLDSVADERGMRVAVDEAGDRAQPASVELDDVVADLGHVGHAPDRGDAVVRTEDERVVEPIEIGERAATEGRVPPRRRDDLAEVADQQPAHAASVLRLARRSAGRGRDSAAATIASS